MSSELTPLEKFAEEQRSGLYEGGTPADDKPISTYVSPKVGEFISGGVVPGQTIEDGVPIFVDPNEGPKPFSKPPEKPDETFEETKNMNAWKETISKAWKETLEEKQKKLEIEKLNQEIKEMNKPQPIPVWERVTSIALLAIIAMSAIYAVYLIKNFRDPRKQVIKDIKSVYEYAVSPLPGVSRPRTIVKKYYVKPDHRLEQMRLEAEIVKHQLTEFYKRPPVKGEKRWLCPSGIAFQDCVNPKKQIDFYKSLN